MSATILPFVRPQHEAVMAIQSHVPESAITADLLGTLRNSHAVQVSEDGLMLTVGYSVLEADEIWITNKRGKTTEGILLANDFNSGIALIKPASPIGTTWFDTANKDQLKAGDTVSIYTSEDNKPMEAVVFAKEEFAGRWEYLLEEAFYTVPLCEHWSGAALVNNDGKLCGIGSLAIGLASPQGQAIPGNLFIPVELVMPHLEHMALYGETPEDKRPWLGILTEEHDAELHVTGVYSRAPAAKAGIKPGDVILSVENQPVASLAGFFRSVWRCGPAGTEIPLTIRNSTDSETRDITLQTIDRNAYFIDREYDTLN